jgi:RHS repeat-associated protein
MAGTANAISFVWDGTDVLNEYVPGGLSGRYLTLDGEVLSEKRGASRYVYGVEPLGSVVHLLDSGLNRAGTYVYWPYGEVQSHTGVDTPMQFVGNLGYYTSTTNRVYVRARWLRPDLARWLTEDPIGFEGGDWNLYGYVDDGPTGATDPTGHRKWCIHLPFRNCIGNGCKGDRHCRPRGGDVKDLATCLGQDCRGMTGEELAACLGKCLGKGAIDANCSEIVCSVPQWKHFCQNGDPCKKKSAFKYYQDCCEIAYYCCLGTRGLTGLIACQLEHKACTCGYGEIK